MAKSVPLKKIPREVHSALKRNGFTFTRYTSHAVFTHNESQKVFTVSVSKPKGRSFVGSQYVLSKLKAFLKAEGLPFVE